MRVLGIIGKTHRYDRRVNLNAGSASSAMRRVDEVMIEGTSVRVLNQKLTKAIPRVGERGYTVD